MWIFVCLVYVNVCFGVCERVRVNLQSQLTLPPKIYIFMIWETNSCAQTGDVFSGETQPGVATESNREMRINLGLRGCWTEFSTVQNQVKHFTVKLALGSSIIFFLQIVQSSVII